MDVVLIILLVPFILFLFLPWLSLQVLNMLDLHTFKDFPGPLRAMFYVNWAFFNITGLVVLVAGIGQGQPLGHVLEENKELSWAVILLFFPLFAGLWRFIQHKKRRPTFALMAIVSLLACSGLFALSILAELFRDYHFAFG